MADYNSIYTGAEIDSAVGEVKNKNFASPIAVEGDYLSPFSMKNKLINGGFHVSQRGTSWIGATITDYYLDRWQIVAGGATFNISQEFSNSEARNYLRLNITSAPTSTLQLVQKIEGVETLAGKTATLSFDIQSDVASTTMSAIRIRQDFGVGGSASVDKTLATNIVVTSTVVRHSYTVALDSIDIKTIGTESFLMVSFDIGDSNIDDFNFFNVQLEEGSVATPFEQRPIGLELILCHRYYIYSNLLTYLVPPYNSTTNLTRVVRVPFPVEMRTTPSLTLIEETGFSVAPTTTINQYGWRAGGTASTAVVLSFVTSYTADAEL